MYVKQPSDGIDTIYQSNQPDMNNFVFISYSSESVTEKLYPGQKTPPPTTDDASRRLSQVGLKGLSTGILIKKKNKGEFYFYLYKMGETLVL